ncbi:hypothetical protein PPERSA_02227 [Pseudocohnilembus persalinus]|uniref:Growth arrest-specific protein 8 domain-containing protein n=1 Tax=Pseudocohnilembus persalinus TaxID=266149 RepID=A0A0V0QKM9_PSEPJ|nr:hypothetical protein PPERSA_02227 [Pseudocohnilembus persalinus]|eukprot:KRX02737.1 hypothetical protein PPERSA_02227 [Pseudocohnilembus persalinus]
MPKKSKKSKIPPEPTDPYSLQLKEMSGQQLQSELQLMREKLDEMRTKRNYIQMDRDMVEQFYHNTYKEIDEIKVKVVNKETEAEQLEEEHRVEVKVYLQKVKHIEYEKERSNEDIQDDGDQAKSKENDYFEEQIKKMKENKQRLKYEQVENEKYNIVKIEEKQNENERKLIEEKKKFDHQIKQLTVKYEDRLQKLKEDLQLKLKVEIHELEERKNQHINELLRNHEKAFAELKTYYKDITSENLNLIKGQKEEIARMAKNAQKNKKKLDEMKEKNDSLRGPLNQQTAIKNALLEDLKQFQKHKMSLQNLKSKLVTLKEKIVKLQKDSVTLDEQYTKVLQEKKDLEEKFENITLEVKKDAETSNRVLNSRLEMLFNQLDAKETQIKNILDKGQIDPILYQELVQKTQQSIEGKNTQVKNLKYSIHHATKAYNDAIRVYEAKLEEFGIPPEELGFQTLETITSTMPAGLVSS